MKIILNIGKIIFILIPTWMIGLMTYGIITSGYSTNLDTILILSLFFMVYIFTTYIAVMVSYFY